MTVSPIAMSTQTSFDNLHSLGHGIDGFAGGYQSASLPVSRSGSVKNATNGALVRDRRSMTGPVPPAFKRTSLNSALTYADSNSLPSSTASTPLLMGSNRQSGQFSYSTAQDQTNSGAFPYNPEMTSTSNSRVQNSLPQISGTTVLHSNGFDWTSYSTDTKQNHSNVSLPDAQQTNYLSVKAEPPESKLYLSGATESQNDDLLSGLFGTPSTTGAAAQEAFQHWNMHHTQTDAFQINAQQLASLFSNSRNAV